MFRMTEANKIKKEIKQRIAELREREIDPSRFVRALVTDPSLVGNRKEQLRFMNDLYCVASVMTSSTPSTPCATTRCTSKRAPRPNSATAH